MSQRRQAVDNTVSDLTGPKFEPLISHSETNALPLDQLAVVSGVDRYLHVNAHFQNALHGADFLLIKEK